jgi:toxin ParE1/3/4
MSFRVTEPAEADLIGIARYTRRQWGLDRVESYINSLFESFQRLADNPEVGHERGDLRPGLRIVLYLQHYYICYRIDGDEVQILRVVHTRRDLARQIAALRGPSRP